MGGGEIGRIYTPRVEKTTSYLSMDSRKTVAAVTQVSDSPGQRKYITGGFQSNTQLTVCTYGIYLFFVHFYNFNRPR